MIEFVCEACGEQFPLSEQGRDERLCVGCDLDRYYAFETFERAEQNVLFGNPELYMT